MYVYQFCFHPSQLIHRDADRKLIALRQENETLKRSYVQIEDEMRDLDFSYQDLKFQLEAAKEKGM